LLRELVDLLRELVDLLLERHPALRLREVGDGKRVLFSRIAVARGVVIVIGNPVCRQESAGCCSVDRDAAACPLLGLDG
jgi:hypothetical protein